MALARDGGIAVATDGARRWLHAYFDWKPSNRRLPAVLESWRARHRVDRLPDGDVPRLPEPFTANRDDRALTVRLLLEGGEEILVLRETRQGLDPVPLEARGLTRREVEVLGWVVEGKTNPEIAEILGLSRRTVHHHLDSTYRKLGVETRTAAARVARELAETDL